jgi:hypothetical protein
MKDVVLYRALEGFCRQRAQMEGESSSFWLEEADILSRLVTIEGRLKLLDEEKSSPELGA